MPRVEEQSEGQGLIRLCFYIARDAGVNLPHLKARLIDSGAIGEDFDLTRDSLIGLLDDRFSTIDYEAAKEDVLPYIKNKSSLDFGVKISLRR